MHVVAHVVVLCFFLSHSLSQVHRKSDLGDVVDGTKGDTIELLSDDDGGRKRGVALWSSRKTHLARRSFFKLSLIEPLR